MAMATEIAVHVCVCHTWVVQEPSSMWLGASVHNCTMRDKTHRQEHNTVWLRWTVYSMWTYRLGKNSLWWKNTRTAVVSEAVRTDWARGDGLGWWQCSRAWCYTVYTVVKIHKCKLKVCSQHGAPLSVGFSRQEHWSGLSCPPPGDLPDPILSPASICIGRQVLHH